MIPRALRIPDPGVFVTVYGDLKGSPSTVEAIETLSALAGGGDFGVCIHDPPGEDEAALVKVVHDRGLRLAYAWGVDPDVKRRPLDAAQITRRRARLAAERGAEIVELNGEAAWRDPKLGTLARVMCNAVREGAPGASLSWTSYDHVGYHGLPWQAISEECDLFAPQYYVANPGAPGPEGHRSALARLDKACGQLAVFVDRGLIRPEHGRGGIGWTPYAQAHGCTAAAVALVLDQAPLSRAWAIPTRVDAEGLRGLKALLIARRESGREAGAIARWQAAHGLAADGAAGPKTLAAMGL